MFEAAFPVEHGPARIIVLRKFTEHALEIDLAVAERAEASGPLQPILVAAIYARAAVRMVLGILDVERANALVVDVDEGEVVQLLQDEVTRVVQDVGARVLADAVEKALERHAVMQILARVQLEADIHAGFIESVQDRAPAFAEFRERFLDQPFGSL